jgi:hypothetical protein
VQVRVTKYDWRASYPFSFSRRARSLTQGDFQGSDRGDQSPFEVGGELSPRDEATATARAHPGSQQDHGANVPGLQWLPRVVDEAGSRIRFMRLRMAPRSGRALPCPTARPSRRATRETPDHACCSVGRLVRLRRPNRATAPFAGIKLGIAPASPRACGNR